MSETSATQGISQIYRDYIDTFNTGDCAAVARLIAYPVMVGGSGHPLTTIADEAGYTAMLESTLDAFREQGWVRSQIDRLEAVETAGDTGIVGAGFSRWRADGSQIAESNGHYVTRKIDGEWRIIAAIVA